MALQIIVDSASDILPAEAETMGLMHLPMTVRFGEREYQDGITLSHEAFYEELADSDTLPVTSQIPPSDFEEAYKRVTEAGNTALVITLSSKLSGTYQSAVMAAEAFGDTVAVVDSESATLGERLLVQRAVMMREEGLSASAIAAVLNREKKRLRLIALLDTLEYLKKGGRISAATAFAGGLLSIKPVVTVEEGAVVLAGKARGSKNGNNLLRELVAKGGGIDYTMPYCLAYSGLSDTLLQQYIVDSEELWKGQTDTLPVATVGCTIGTHIGPGAIAVAFFEKEN